MLFSRRLVEDQNLLHLTWVMKSTSTGKDKVKKICDVLKRETLDPALKQAEAILCQAKEDAAQVIQEAKQEAQKMHREAEEQIAEKRRVFDSSIHLACKKSVSTLKEEIENHLFNPELRRWIGQGARDPHLLAQLIEAIVKGIEKEGIDAHLQALIPSCVSIDAINRELVQGILKKLEGNSVQIGDFQGGVELKIVNQNMSIDITDSALKSLIARFVRDEFRTAIFGKD